MDVCVRAIEPQAEHGVYAVTVAIGIEQRHFMITVVEDTIDGQQLQVITGAPTLQRELHHDIRLDTAIRKLAGRCYNGKRVTLPMVVGQVPEGTFAPVEEGEQG